VLAVLSREVSVLALLGLAIWRRDGYGAWLVVVPSAAGVAWFLRLRAVFPGVGYGSDRSPFFRGLRYAAPYWWRSDHAALGVALLAALLAVGALAAARHGPLFWPITLNLVIVFFLADEALDLFWNLSRTLLPAMLLSVVVLLAESRRSRQRAPGVTGPDRSLRGVVARDHEA
jgi:hypothetical protein